MGERGGPILVVDDDPKIVQLVRAYLEREGLAVVTAADGKAALAAIAAHDPRLVVLDHQPLKSVGAEHQYADRDDRHRGRGDGHRSEGDAQRRTAHVDAFGTAR